MYGAIPPAARGGGATYADVSHFHHKAQCTLGLATCYSALVPGIYSTRTQSTGQEQYVLLYQVYTVLGTRAQCIQCKVPGIAPVHWPGIVLEFYLSEVHYWKIQI